ncbi:uncharacterized protein [Chlorocebus sabaeus]|uniref:uncharacterized protein n=1 Tax=Chlorocebus sabaeus TaxID=60711 RepID=UPI003BF95998
MHDLLPKEDKNDSHIIWRRQPGKYSRENTSVGDLKKLVTIWLWTKLHFFAAFCSSKLLPQIPPILKATPRERKAWQPTDDHHILSHKSSDFKRNSRMSIYCLYLIEESHFS